MLCRCHERPDQQDLPPPFRYDARHRRLLTASACSCHSRSCYELVHSVLLVLCVIAVVIEIQVPVSCGEVAVVPGDIVVGDEEGVIVIPVRQPAPAGAVLPPDRGVQGYGGGVHTPRAGIP